MTNATTTALTRRTGMTLRSTARKRAVTWPLSTQRPFKTMWWTSCKEEPLIMLGLEATTSRRRAFGSGQIVLLGNSQIGDLPAQIMPLETRTACNMTSNGNGMMISAFIKSILSVARIFARTDQNLANCAKRVQQNY